MGKTGSFTVRRPRPEATRPKISVSLAGHPAQTAAGASPSPSRCRPRRPAPAAENTPISTRLGLSGGPGHVVCGAAAGPRRCSSLDAALTQAG